MGELLASSDKQISESKMIKLLGLTDKDLTELKQEVVMGEGEGNPKLSNNEINDSQDKKDLRNKKREEQESTQGSIMKSTGTGKELTKDVELELKETTGDSEDIDFNSFIRLYNEDKAYHPGKPPRIFVRRNDQFTSLKYKSSDFVYRSVITNELYDENVVGRMNLNLFKL